MIIMPDSDTLDSVLNHMRYNDIACYFLHVGSQFHPHCSFGFVPYSEIMQLIAVATNGSYMQYPSQHVSIFLRTLYLTKDVVKMSCKLLKNYDYYLHEIII